MRRLSVLACAFLALAACTSSSGLPPEEVLTKTILASRELQSAAFDATVSAASTTPDGSFAMDAKLEGRLQDGGRQVAFDLTVQVTTKTGDAAKRIQGKAEVRVLGANETYLHVESLTADPPDPLFSGEAVTRLIGQWWKLPATATGATSPSMDPTMLTLQTESLRVVKDHGIEKAGGRSVYHYDVAIDPAKLRAFMEETSRQGGEPLPDTSMIEAWDFAGEAWIDAETFQLRKVIWTATSKDPSNKATAEITLNVTEHNEAEPISPPQDVQPFPTDASQFLPLMQPAAVSPLPSEENPMTPEEQELMLRSLLEQR